jgi:hypothetical protein
MCFFGPIRERNSGAPSFDLNSNGGEAPICGRPLATKEMCTVKIPTWTLSDPDLWENGDLDKGAEEDFGWWRRRFHWTCNG